MGYNWLRQWVTYGYAVLGLQLATPVGYIRLRRVGVTTGYASGLHTATPCWGYSWLRQWVTYGYAVLGLQLASPGYTKDFWVIHPRLRVLQEFC